VLREFCQILPWLMIRVTDIVMGYDDMYLKEVEYTMVAQHALQDLDITSGKREEPGICRCIR